MSRDIDIAIVLTAAIIVSTGSTAVTEIEARRHQYLTSARFYAQFAPVFFVENSGYDLLNDAEFRAIPGVRLRPVTAQMNESRGKGYREFHALDLWYQNEQEKPCRILKITGRYIFANIKDLLAECDAAPDGLLLFDRHHYARFAVTSIFSASWVDYGRYVEGYYAEADDPAGAWIERILYRALDERRASCRCFRHEPDVRGISGTTGRTMGASRFEYALKSLLRAANRLVDRRYLYLRGETLMPLKRLIR